MVSSRRIPVAILVGAWALACGCWWASNPSNGVPTDDSYIYQVYAIHASQGAWFEYNPGEASGGITGFLWFLILTAIAWGSSALGLASPNFGAMHAVSALALLGSVLMVRAAVLCTARSEAAALLVAGAFLADPCVLWGTFSGLEPPVAIAVVAASVWAFAAEREAGRLRASPWLMALGCWARPEMILLPLAAMAVVGLDRERPASRRAREVLAIGLAAALLAGAMAAVFADFTGLPLPSSFYAKSMAPHDLDSLGFSLSVMSLSLVRAVPAVWPWFLAALLGWLFADDRDRRALHLPLLFAALIVAARVWTMPHVGQVGRYIGLVFPGLAVGAGLLVAGVERRLAASGALRAGAVVAAALLALLLARGIRYGVADYPVHVRNIDDAHVVPARWIRDHTPPDAVVAMEPAGALRLYGERRTFDIVGLTTPEMLGHYRDWEFAEAHVRRSANYLLYYPAWFPAGQVPDWLHPVQSFDIPDNRMAGSSPIVVYAVEPLP